VAGPGGKVATAIPESGKGEGSTVRDLPEHPQDDAALVENQRNQRVLTALIAEVDRYVAYKPDGTWAVDPSAMLSPQARQFVTEALSKSDRASIAESRAGTAATFGATLANSGGVRSLTCYWWGCRLGFKTGDAQGVAHAWRTAGAKGAIKVFLGYFGYSGWAAGVAAVLVPAYAITVSVVDRLGGYRGVYMNVPWSIAGTVITPQ